MELSIDKIEPSDLARKWLKSAISYQQLARSAFDARRAADAVRSRSARTFPRPDYLSLAPSPAPSFFVPRAPARLIPTERGSMVATQPGWGAVPKWNRDGTRNGTGFSNDLNGLTGRFHRFHSLARACDTITHTRAYVRPISMEPVEPVEPKEYVFDILWFSGSIFGSTGSTGWNRRGRTSPKCLETNKIWGGYRRSGLDRADKGLFGGGGRRKFRRGVWAIGAPGGLGAAGIGGAEGNGGFPPFSRGAIAHVGRAMLEGSAQSVDPAAFSGRCRQSARLNAAGADRGGGGAARGGSPHRAPPSPLLLAHEIFRILVRRPCPPSLSALPRAPFLDVIGRGRGCGSWVRCPAGRGEARSLTARNRGRGHGERLAIAAGANGATLGRGWGRVN